MPVVSLYRDIQQNCKKKKKHSTFGSNECSTRLLCILLLVTGAHNFTAHVAELQTATKPGRPTTIQLLPHLVLFFSNHVRAPARVVQRDEATMRRPKPLPLQPPARPPTPHLPLQAAGRAIAVPCWPPDPRISLPPPPPEPQIAQQSDPG